MSSGSGDGGGAAGAAGAGGAKVSQRIAHLQQRLQRQTSLRHTQELPVTDDTLDEAAQLERDDVWQSELTVVVIGASGDLAKKKTYPALFTLFEQDLLPPHAHVIGFARSKLDADAFRARIGERFAKRPKAAAFLERCTYVAGQYDDAASYAALRGACESVERAGSRFATGGANRVVYLAIPPSLFVAVGKQVHASLTLDPARGDDGWTRVVVEKPFGRDTESFVALGKELSMFTEEQLYRIDHYLGKEMVQNLMTLRFANALFEPVWNRHHVANVVITFKEPIDVGGRGGYFDQFGIIRDVMQNHLLQILSLVAMEPPVSPAAEDVRDEKTKVLRCVPPIEPCDVVIGQYGTDADGKQEAYRAHHDVPDASRTPTFAAAVLRVNNERWRGVPFVMKCGKGLNERKAEIRVQFRENATGLFGAAVRNEVVLRVQPDEAIYVKMMAKRPGLRGGTVQTTLDLGFKEAFAGDALPDAYERLIYDVLRGDHNLFVRDDELLAAWKIFTPLLKHLEAPDAAARNVPALHTYQFGSRGPPQADDLLRAQGFKYSSDYKWHGTPRTATPSL
mmetsp:Transcript_31009/g.75869  ORF Transcript_31009/g.75869 Transcript_31009/m.75869 type:complete len:565 (-) Transcript_31009:69-1763(-)